MKKHVFDAAKPARSFEKESSLDCLSCGSLIQHPLCAECIAAGFMQWTCTLPREGKKLCEDVRGFLAAHRRFSGMGVRCISCNNKRASLCPHCFVDILYEWVCDAHVSFEKRNEFLFMFDFDDDDASFELEYGG